jgi:hypothetical protein
MKSNSVIATMLLTLLGVAACAQATDAGFSVAASSRRRTLIAATPSGAADRCSEGRSGWSPSTDRI